jgi:hypothetical protein
MADNANVTTRPQSRLSQKNVQTDNTFLVGMPDLFDIPDIGANPTPHEDRGEITSSEFSTTQIQQIIGGGGDPAPVIRYKMRAVESGGGCVGVVYRVWEAVGTPDLTGTQYTGTRCSPPGTFIEATILEVIE